MPLKTQEKKTVAGSARGGEAVIKRWKRKGEGGEEGSTFSAMIWGRYY